jgi:predicted transcriptional regulator
MEIYEMETKRTMQRINEKQTFFFEKVNKTDSPSVKLAKRKREKTQTIKEKTKGILQQIPVKSGESLRNTLKTCIPRN